MKKIAGAGTVLAVMVAGLAAVPAGAATMDHIRLFENYFTDAVSISDRQVDAGLQVLDDSGFSSVGISAQGDMPMNDRIDVGGSLGFVSIDPDGAPSQSGLLDPVIGVRLKATDLAPDTHLSFGGMMSLPIGDDDVGGGDFDLGAFVAIRHAVQGNLVFTGKAALVSVEVGNDRDLSLQLGGGAIYHYLPTTYLISELEVETDTDYSVLSFGADYSTDPDAHFRASIQFGLDDGAADLGLTGSYLYRF